MNLKIMISLARYALDSDYRKSQKEKGGCLGCFGYLLSPLVLIFLIWAIIKFYSFIYSLPILEDFGKYLSNVDALESIIAVVLYMLIYLTIPIIIIFIIIFTIAFIFNMFFLVMKKFNTKFIRYTNNGFDGDGIHKNGTLYNDDGYDKDGYDIYGYDKNGYDNRGYDRYGSNMWEKKK